jgi:hypothetical protein
MSKHAANTDRLLPLAEEINFTWEGPSCRPQLPSVDDDSLIQGVEDAGVRISNNHTGHGTLLAWDQIHHYATDPDRGDRNGFLILNTQVNIGGNSLWCEPTFRPGEALPDPFGDVRGWKRENDPLYIQNLYGRSTQPRPTTAPSQGATGVGLAVVLCVCFGVGLAIANA